METHCRIWKGMVWFFDTQEGRVLECVPKDIAEATKDIKDTTSSHQGVTKQSHIKTLVQMHLGLCSIDLVRQIEGRSRMATVHQNNNSYTSWHFLHKAFVQIIVKNLASPFEIQRDQSLVE